MSFLRSVTRVLPPPQFITLPSLGVDISESSLKYIQFTPNHSGEARLQLAHWGDIAVPAGVIERGDVKDPALLAEILREVKKRTGIGYVRLSLPEERAYIFETAIDKDTSFSEIRGQLEFKLEENVPIPPRETVFDFDVLSQKSKSAKELHLSVTAYARNTVMGYFEACQAADLMPLSFEVEAQAIARALLPKEDTSTTMVIDFGKTRTGVGIVHRGVLLYTSTIDIGGAELSSALRRQLGNLSDSELVKLKNKQGLVRGVDDSSVYDALLSTVSAIQNEVALRINYWNNKEGGHEGRQIQSIVLCGGSANLRGLPGYFTETLGIRTKRAEVWTNAFDFETTIPPIGKRYSYGYTTAIGLALTQFYSLYE